MEIFDDGKVIVLDSRSLIKTSYTSHAPLPCTASPLQPYEVRREVPNGVDSNGDDGDLVKKRKRKRPSKYQPNQPEIDFNARHNAIEPHLSFALERLQIWMDTKNSITIPQALRLDIQTSETNKTSQPSSLPSPPPLPLPPLDYITLAALRTVAKPKFSWTSDDEDKDESDNRRNLNLFDKFFLQMSQI
jgi:hypothetical protein